MSTQTILWLLLITSVAAALCGAHLLAQVRHLIRWRIGIGALLVMAVGTHAYYALMVTVAFRTGYWQLGAMVVAQALISYAADAGKPAPTLERP